MPLVWVCCATTVGVIVQLSSRSNSSAARPPKVSTLLKLFLAMAALLTVTPDVGKKRVPGTLSMKPESCSE